MSNEKKRPKCAVVNHPYICKGPEEDDRCTGCDRLSADSCPKKELDDYFTAEEKAAALTEALEELGYIVKIKPKEG